MSHLFQDQTAVITGAGGVLCSEIAVKLAAEGAKTVLVGRTEEKLKKVEAQILAAGGACMVRTADVTDEAAMEALADEVERTCGPCRYLINGAGGNNNKAITTNFTYEPEELQENKPEDMVGFLTWIWGFLKALSKSIPWER